jgi:hypothetical protein
MKLVELFENYTAVWGRNSKGVVRKYRCTSGPKKGRVVAKASTCSTPVSQSKSVTMKKTRRTQARKQALRRYYTMRRPTSQKLQKLNRIRPRRRSKARRR